jgi:nucleoid-associated protein YgaU
MSADAPKPIEPAPEIRTKGDENQNRSSLSLAQEVDQTRAMPRPQAPRQDDKDDKHNPRTMNEFAERSIQAHLNPSDSATTISRVADAAFERQNVGSSGFEARQYAIQANRADGRPVVDTVSLNAGGTHYEGWRAVNPESGREYFYSNQGQRFEMIKGESGYTALKPMGAAARDAQPILISSEPRTQHLADVAARVASQQRPGGDMRPPIMSMPHADAREMSQRPESAPRAEATRQEGPVQMRAEMVNGIREQIARRPELLAELQKSHDPRAAYVLQELGHAPAGHAVDGQPGKAPLDAFPAAGGGRGVVASFLHTLHTNEQLVGLLRGNEILNGALRSLDANSTRLNLGELSNVLKSFNGMQEAGRTADWQHILRRTPDTAGLSAGMKEFVVSRAQDQANIRETIDRLLGRHEDRHTTRENVARPESTHGEHAARVADAAANLERTLKAQEAEAKNDLIKNDPLETKRQEAEEIRRREEEEKQRTRKIQEEEYKPLPQPAEAALLAAMAGKTKEPTEDAKVLVVDNSKRDEEKRVKYIVKQGDTLESIAFKILRDKRLAGLIYDINKIVIPVRRAGGRNVIELKTGLTLWLPTGTDIKDYRVRLMTGAGAPPPGQTTQSASPSMLPAQPAQEFVTVEEELEARFGSNWASIEPGDTALEIPAPATTLPAPHAMPANTAKRARADDVAEMDANARASFQSRRDNIEKVLGPIVPKSEDVTPHYVVRLGDTLKSIAMKHPALNDIKLWRLLAQVNDIPVDVDERGNPVARVKRGQILNLPMQDEIDAFRSGEAQPGKRIDIMPAVPHPSATLPAAENPVAAEFIPVLTGTVPVAASLLGPDAQPPSGPRRTDQRLQALSQQNVVPGSDFVVLKERNGNSRLLQAGNVENIGAGLRMQLEAWVNSVWLPVVIYEIYDDVSLRHECKPDGTRKTIRIDLPPQAAVELANNDLHSNWLTYCSKFV